MNQALIKRYSQDPAKSKSRLMFRDFIKANLAPIKRADQVKVLCFPGIDAVEVFEVYDALGIPRQNIVGLERERKVAEELERKNLGIKVVHRTVEDYVAEQKNLDFDVVSLDYVGPIDWKQMDLMDQIRTKQRKDEFVFHSNNLARRDHNSVEFYSAGFALNSMTEGLKQSMQDKDAIMYRPEELHRKFLEVFVNAGGEFFEKRQSEGTSQEDKSQSYAITIKMGFIGRTPEVVDKVFRFISGREYEEAKAQVIAQTKQFFQEHNITGRDPWRTATSLMTPGAIMVKRMQIWCKNNGLPEELADVFVHAINTTAMGRYYLPIRSDGYSYISESGSPMIGQMVFLQYLKEFYKANRRLAEEIGFPNAPRRANVQQLYPILRKLQFHYTDPRANYNSYLTEGQTLFLGNSSKPVLSKKKFIEELESGKSADEIRAAYRGWQNKPLAQWQAHYSMGTYQSQEVREVELEDSDLEKITKEEAIDMLSAGIPANEIHHTYPTSFTRGQLGAFQAHIKMGTYKEAETKVN